MKESDALSSFKRRIKSWKGEECNCRLCMPFVAPVGFLKGLMRSIVNTEKYCKNIVKSVHIIYTYYFACILYFSTSVLFSGIELAFSL